YISRALADTSVDRIDSLAPQTWRAILVIDAFGAISGSMCLVPGVAERVRLAAAMAGFAERGVASTPGLHTIASDPMSHARRRDVVAFAEPEAQDSDPEAFTAFKDLGRWLNADDEQIAGMLGIGRTTAYSWKRERREPRPDNARRIYEFHAVLDSVRRH